MIIILKVFPCTYNEIALCSIQYVSCWNDHDSIIEWLCIPSRMLPTYKFGSGCSCIVSVGRLSK